MTSRYSRSRRNGEPKESSNDPRSERPKPKPSTADQTETKHRRRIGAATMNLTSKLKDIYEDMEPPALTKLEDDIYSGRTTYTRGRQILEQVDIYSESESEEKGPLVDAKLVTLLQDRFGEKMSDKQLREKSTPYRIIVPAWECSTHSIFNVFQPHIRSDIRQSTTQQSISRTAVAITKCVDRLLAIRRDTKKTGAVPTSKLCQVSLCINKLAYGQALTG